MYLSGIRSRSDCSTFSGVSPSARPILGQMRRRCVSTGIVCSPQITFKTTFAVLRPTPGRLINSSRERGTFPSKSEISFSHRPMTCRALERYRPMDLIYSISPSSPRARIFCGVSATLYNSLVAIFTDLSVAWADKTTATSSVNGEEYSSSDFGLGFN